MEWFKKHTDLLILLSVYASGFLWMNGKFNEIDKKFSELEKEMAIVKTVLVMTKIMPSELAIKNEIGEK